MIKVTFRNVEQIKRNLVQFQRRDLAGAKIRVAVRLRDEGPLLLWQMLAYNRFRLPALAPSTLARRSTMGGGIKQNTPLYDSGAYARSWKAEIVMRGESLGVSLYPAGFDSRTGISRAVLAAMLEHGTRRMPARPHIGPITRELHSRMMRYLQQEVRRGLSRHS